MLTLKRFPEQNSSLILWSQHYILSWSLLPQYFNLIRVPLEGFTLVTKHSSSKQLHMTITKRTEVNSIKTMSIKEQHLLLVVKGDVSWIPPFTLLESRIPSTITILNLQSNLASWKTMTSKERQPFATFVTPGYLPFLDTIKKIQKNDSNNSPKAL